MKIFVSYPYVNEESMKQLDKICKYLDHKGITVISYIHLFSYKDKINLDNKRFKKMVKDLIDMADEVWVYSELKPCKFHENYAKEKKKPVKYMYQEINIKKAIEKNRCKGI